MGKHHECGSGGSPAGGGGGYRSTLLFDKRAVELPFIQTLTPRHVCLLYTAEDSGRFLMIYESLRSHNPVLTLWLLPGFASPPKIPPSSFFV